MKIFRRPKQILASDIAARHPKHLICSTDIQYAKLATEIYNLAKDDLRFLDNEGIKNASISLALYFEDIHSGTHQFETFTKLYHEMFGYYVPFYDSKSSTDESAEIDAMRFVLWLCSISEREDLILNPINDGNRDVAFRLWDFWLSIKDEIKPNTELADHLFCEETQLDPMCTKNVLIWLQYDSFLGRHPSSKNLLKDPFGISRLFDELADDETLDYAIQCYSVFKCRTWPLSLQAQHIYAEMIRLEMEDKDDLLAEDIEKMKCAEFGFWEIIGTKEEYLMVRDFKGNEISVRLDSFAFNFSKEVKSFTHIVGSFFNMAGEWFANGINSLTNFTKFDEYKKQALIDYDYAHNHTDQYDDFIAKHDGNRMFFFNNVQEVVKFNEKELGFKEELNKSLLRYKGHVMSFFEPNGHYTINTEIADVIKHPDNPFYNKRLSEDRSLFLIGATDSCTADTLAYIIGNGYLPDALINDIRGKEYGRRTMQENMEFFARCYRRDIYRDDAFSKRIPISIPERG